MPNCSSKRAEMQYGLNLCLATFGHDIVMAIDPDSVCMVNGPGTEFCLQGRCFEIVNEMTVGDEAPRQNPSTMAPIAFYVKGSDERTEECREVLAEYQKRHR